MYNTPGQFARTFEKLIPDHPEIIATRIYLFLMLVVFPLFFIDDMFDLYQDKRNFFLFFSIVYMWMLLPAVMAALRGWRHDMHAPAQPDSIFALILLAALVISTVFAADPRGAFLGMTSRTVSGLCFLCCILIFFSVRQYGQVDIHLLRAWLAGSSGLYIFGILCACGFNVMHIQNGLIPAQLTIFLTPLSHTNFNTCYVCLTLPPVLVMYMVCRQQFTQLLCGAGLYLGFMFIFFIKTESSIIAILSGMLLLGYFALENGLWAKRHVQMTGIYLGAKLTVYILLNLFPERLYPFHGLGLALLDSRLIICGIVCYLLFAIIWHRKKEALRITLSAARKPLAMTGAAVVCCCAAWIIFVNINAARLPAESFLNHFVLTDTTFSQRGYIWRRTASALKEEPAGRKLIGNGMNSFRAFICAAGALPADMNYEDPHSEFLQMAADMGILGLIGYFGLLLYTLGKGLRNWKKNKFHIITVLTLAVYMVQALANEYSIYTLPLLCIFLGLVNSRSINSC